MHPPGLFQILVLVLIALVLFGRGRIGNLMGDFGKGVKSFRKALGEDDDEAARIPGPRHEAVPASQTAAEPNASPDQTNG